MIGDPGLPVARVEFAPADDAPVGDGWPWTLPPVRQLIAQAYGLSPEGGSAGARHRTRPTESDLHRSLRLRRGFQAPRWGFFLRAETMHGFYTYLEQNPGSRDPGFHEHSHGESFLAVLQTRFDSPGFYCLDEPESALSFSGCLTLIGVLPDATILEVGE